ncbi:hypothetical protein [Pseudonocardia sp.]|uniref:hypothetical protein n=1 Tax=Pseudonocardia sp. TaxID=60912 RepID=UPI002607A92E|nr:hypothetical protein [Pseudonocardia sp.]
MTIPNPTDAPVLLTDADVLDRVRALVGRACTDRQLWIMFVDGDGRQAPVVMPIADLPRHPEPGGLAGLAGVLGGLRDELATDLGPGSVILTLERLGPDRTLPQDRDWAQALTDACIAAAVELRGIFLSTRGGARRLL